MIILDFINVGYGDAVLMREKETGFAALIDCGASQPECPGTGRVSAVKFLERQKIEKLDVLVLTHLHQDHCGAVAEIVEQFDVRELWTNYLPPETYWGTALRHVGFLGPVSQKLVDAIDNYLQALALLRCRGAAIRQIGATGSACWTNKLKVHFFHSEEQEEALQRQILLELLTGETSEERLLNLDRILNQTSLRLRLEYGNSTVELPGDLNAENYAKQHPGKCTILKLSHHGHKDSMSEELLGRLMPEGVVVSVALEKGDICPDPQILTLLEKNGCQVAITDEAEAQKRGSVRMELTDRSFLLC